MPTLGFLKSKKKKDKESLHARSGSTQSTEIRNQSEPPTPTTATSSTSTNHTFHNSTASQSSVSTAPQQYSSHPTSATNPVPPADGMALVSDRPMIPSEHQQQQGQSFQASPHQQQPQPHTSNINAIINPPQPGEYDRSGAHNAGYPQQQAGAAQADGMQGVSQQPEQKQQTVMRSTKGKYSLSDFDVKRTLGTGSFGRVHLVQSRHNMRFYAIKVLKKAQVVKMKQVEHTNDERRMLCKVKHPFLITLWGTFQDSRNLYMVMDFIEGGELFSLLRKSQVRLNHRTRYCIV